MSVAVFWPAVLPQHVRREGYAEAPAMRFVSFPSDAGTAIERPRGTLSMVDTDFPFIMTAAQLEAFEAFVTNDISHGALPFIIEHPRRRVLVKAQMTGDPRYTASPLNSLEWLVRFRARVIG
jgi:hypothetical protein